ncbi:MAG: tetratricopeptide repeat protein, partial [Candidatus Cybelea sp.]
AGNAVGVARAQTVAGHALESLGRATEATSVLQTALAAARTLGDRLFVAYVLRVLAHVVFDLGNDIAARTNLEEALRIYENLDAKVEKAWALEDLAEIEFRASHPQPALRHATEMLRIVRELNPEPRLCVHALSAMSLCLMFSDRFDESASYAREALDLALENSLPFFMVWNIHHLAATAVLRAEIAADDRRHARVQAARLLGFVDARLISLMTTPPHANQLEHDHVVAMLKGALGIHAAAMLMAQGATMSEDEAVEMALEL